MVKTNGVLVEYVGGPRDGSIAVVGSKSLRTRLRSRRRGGRYRRAAEPVGDDERDRRAALESFAIERSPDGPPERYVRLVWSADGGRRTRRRSIQRPAAERGSPSQATRFELALRFGATGDAQAIAATFIDDGGSPTALIHELIAPALRSIGESWREGTMGIYDEHLASSIVQGILGVYSGARTGPGRGTAVVWTPVAERHVIPSQMAAVALRDDGWSVDDLAGSTPPAELLDSVARRGIGLVVISKAIGPSNDADVAKVVALVERRGIPVLVGGPNRTLSDLQVLARGAAGP